MCESSRRDMQTTINSSIHLITSKQKTMFWYKANLNCSNTESPHACEHVQFKFIGVWIWILFCARCSSSASLYKMGFKRHLCMKYTVQVIWYLVIQIWCYKLWKIPFRSRVSVSHTNYTQNKSRYRFQYNSDEKNGKRDDKALCYWTLARLYWRLHSCELAATHSTMFGCCWCCFYCGYQYVCVCFLGSLLSLSSLPPMFFVAAST